MISDQILEQVRQSNDIVEVVSSYFPLKRAGANFRALCPFHKEKTPSFNVNPARQIWHCFGCGTGGDVFTFVMKYENLDFVAAVRRLAERAGVHIEWEEAAGGPSRDERELLFALHEQVAAFFHQYLMKDKAAEPARAYLKKRGISSETAKHWRLGYAPDAWDALIAWANPKKFAVELLEQAGLALRREGGEGFYDRFRGRLMFPICDEQGRVVAFSGRILTDAPDQPKYVNSPETPIFQKGKILFALDRAKRAIIDEKCAIVCEGQLDAISCHEAGLTNVVAPQGTALTEQHARILKRYAEEAVLMFDSDAAGQNAIVRSAEPLWEAGLPSRVVVLPQGHDPDSFVKEFGADKLQKLVTKGPSFFVYILERLVEQYDPASDRGRQQITEQMVQWLARLPDPLLVSAFAQQTARRLGIVASGVEQAVLRQRRLKLRQRGLGEVAEQQKPLEHATTAEEVLLQAMLTDERALDRVAGQLDLEWLTDGVAGRAIRRVLNLYNERRWTGPSSLLNEGLDAELNSVVSGLLAAPGVAETADRAAADCLSSLERRWVEARLRDLRKRLGEPKLEASEIEKLQRQVLDLRTKLDNISALLMAKSESLPR